MAKRKLTDAGIKALPVPAEGQIDYFDTLLPAFGLRISYGGARTWFVTTRVMGKPALIRAKLGRYPAMGLSEARDKARSILEIAASGIDPRKIREAERDKARLLSEQTFNAMTADFMSLHVNRAKGALRKNTAGAYQRTFDRAAKEWGSRPVAEISKADVQKFLTAMESKGHLVGADQAFAYLRKFFNWLVEKELVERSPVEKLKRSGSSVARERVLSQAELLLLRTSFVKLGYPFGPLFDVLLLTGQRRNEIAGLQWTELKEWDSKRPLIDLPGERVKNGLSHLVPALPSVKAIIDKCPRNGKYVFSTTGETPVSGFSKAKTAVDKSVLEAMRKTTSTPEAVKPLPHWTLHDLRRSMVTQMNERLGIQPHIVEATINHASGAAKAGVAGVYNRALYLDERREALQKWAKWVSL